MKWHQKRTLRTLVKRLSKVSHLMWDQREIALLESAVARILQATELKNKSNGKRLTQSEIGRIVALRRAGKLYKIIQHDLNVSSMTIRRVLQKNGIMPRSYGKQKGAGRGVQGYPQKRTSELPKSNGGHSISNGGGSG